LFPFILAKPEWGIDAGQITDACQLYPQLRGLRDGLLRVPQAAGKDGPVSLRERELVREGSTA
jgi:hypothetical protein